MRTAAALALSLTLAAGTAAPKRKPNVVFILADDLGYGELGCYGQTKIKTPNLDRLAAEGVRFTQAYSGSPVCAPSRCSLLTGLHTGHSYIRDNDEYAQGRDVWNDWTLEGQRPLLKGTETLGTLMTRAGYATACIGKWGLGAEGTEGHPNLQGFQHFFGYLCQRQAHNHYPDHLWRNHEKVPMEGNRFYKPHVKLPAGADVSDPATFAPFTSKTYALDAMTDEALAFVERHQAKPFFLYFTPIQPHVALQVPQDSLKAYAGAFPETPYRGASGYLPHPTPRAAYAAMISRLDAQVGRLMAKLEALGLAEDTLVVFTSDNGATFNGGVDPAFFQSSGGLRGTKATVFEGGLRVPFVARWKGRIASGRTEATPVAFEDVMPTLAELARRSKPITDGGSLLPLLTGTGKAKLPAHRYWEFQGRQVVREGRWKLIRDRSKDERMLFDLEADPAETTNLVAVHPGVRQRLEALMDRSHRESGLFPLVKR